jgi:signal transduction histidine kinase
VVADAVSLRQMLLNLLANAIKFARRGDRVKVTVAYDADGRCASRWSIRDPVWSTPIMPPAKVLPCQNAHARPTPAWGSACR